MKEIPIYGINDIHSDVMNGNHDTSEFSELVDSILSSESYNSKKDKGILLLIQDKGTEELSKKQIRVIQEMINYYRTTCDLCDGELDWSEIDIFEVSANCSSCQYRIDKEFRD